MKRTIKRNGEISLNMNLQEYGRLVSLLYGITLKKDDCEEREFSNVKYSLLQIILEKGEMDDIQKMYEDITKN